MGTDERARHSPVRTDLDMTGTEHLSLGHPTTNGRTSITLRPNTIDEDALEFFGNSHCHWLAAAICCLTGWRIAAVEIPWARAEQMFPGGFGTDAKEWAAIHSAVLTPAGTILDIFGDRDQKTVAKLYRAEVGCDVRFRTLRVDDQAGDVVVNMPADKDPWWWARDLPDAGRAVFLHYARLVLNKAGYAVPEHCRPAPPPEPAPTPPVPAQHTHHTPSTADTSTGGTPAMASIHEIAAALTSTNEMVETALGAFAAASQNIAHIQRLLHQVAEGSSHATIQEAMGLYAQVADAIDPLMGQVIAAHDAVNAYASNFR